MHQDTCVNATISDHKQKNVVSALYHFLYFLPDITAKTYVSPCDWSYLNTRPRNKM